RGNDVLFTSSKPDQTDASQATTIVWEQGQGFGSDVVIGLPGGEPVTSSDINLKPVGESAQFTLTAPFTLQQIEQGGTPFDYGGDGVTSSTGQTLAMLPNAIGGGASGIGEIGFTFQPGEQFSVPIPVSLQALLNQYLSLGGSLQPVM